MGRDPNTSRFRARRRSRLLRVEPAGKSGHPEQSDVEARKAFWESARSLTPYVAAGYGDAVFILPTVSDGKLFVSNARRSEFVVLERAVSILRDTDRPARAATIVDVGAHIGTTTIPALLHHGFDRAVAIEPDPDNLRLLQANLALNGLETRASVIAAAVSDKAGRHAFVPGSREQGRFKWTKGRLMDEPSAAAIEVETLTLDGMVEDGIVDPAVTGLLWLDCQKEEEEALTRATRFFEHRVPIVFVLRANKLKEDSPLLGRLREASYEQVVDLRRPRADKTVPWKPTFEPVDSLVRLSDRKSLTDVLVL